MRGIHILIKLLFQSCFLLQKPSEYNTYYDIEAVYDCLKKEYGIEQEDLILYGQSVGSGPTLHLASRLEKLRGVVLHSGILSGIRVLYPVKVTLWFDIFKVSQSLDHAFALVLNLRPFIVLMPLLPMFAEHRQNKAGRMSSAGYTCE